METINQNRVHWFNRIIWAWFKMILLKLRKFFKSPEYWCWSWNCLLPASRAQKMLSAELRAIALLADSFWLTQASPGFQNSFIFLRWNDFGSIPNEPSICNCPSSLRDLDMAPLFLLSSRTRITSKNLHLFLTLKYFSISYFWWVPVQRDNKASDVCALNNSPSMLGTEVVVSRKAVCTENWSATTYCESRPLCFIWTFKEKHGRC